LLKSVDNATVTCYYTLRKSKKRGDPKKDLEEIEGLWATSADSIKVRGDGYLDFLIKRGKKGTLQRDARNQSHQQGEKIGYYLLGTVKEEKRKEWTPLHKVLRRSRTSWEGLESRYRTSLRQG